MNRLRLPRVAVLLVLFSWLMLGCGQSAPPRPKVYPVTGRVTMKGEPVRYLAIRLVPAEGKGGYEAEGETDEEGQFNLRTFSNDEPDGALPGTYDVKLTPMPGKNSTELPAELNIQPVVVAEEDNDVTIEVP